MPVSNAQIQQVRELIRAGQKRQAAALLSGMIERDHENPELWWLLANTTDSPTKARAALDYLLTLNPEDSRARTMLKRLEARQLLQQMGLHETAAPVRSSRPLWVGLGAVLATVVLIGTVVITLNLLRGNEDTEVPTLVAFSTDAPATEESSLAFQVATDEVTDPTGSDNLNSQPDNRANAVEGTADVLPVVTEEPVITEEATPEPIITVEVTAPESTGEAIPTLPLNETVADDTPAAETPVYLPEGTQEPLPVDPASDGTQIAAAPPAGAGLSMRGLEDVTDVRGQVLNGVTRRELIQPYGVQGWTFSGYRDEPIRLELVNVTGAGNPSLELRDESGVVVASDIDLTSGSANTDAVLELTLPSDGIYTVVVRMASLDEQLYELRLTRG